MNMFLIGVLVGAASFALLYIVMVLSKIHAGMMYLNQVMDSITKALNVSLLKLNKIEKVTQETMTAAETFVDGLRESAEHLQRHMRPPRMGKMNDSFDDLRQSFEEGIRDIEEGMNNSDNDEDSDEQQEPWK